MSDERRRNTRSGLKIEDQHNLFFLKTQGDVHPITLVRDVSVSGVGLEMNQPFQPGEAVSLKYDADDFELTITGTIIWCQRIEQNGRYNLGIEFDRQNGENNALFFLALRKYLDEFDGAYIDT